MCVCNTNIFSTTFEMIIKPLSDCDATFVETIAKIYMHEWGWHYKDEWNVHTLDEMIHDISMNYLNDIYIGLDDYEFVGTVALIDEDLKSHKHLAPWVSCLYVKPKYRNQGYGKIFMDYVCKDHSPVYLWCYTTHECNLYKKWGFKIVESVKYRDDKDAFIMAK